MNTVLSVSTSRADVGILSSVWRAIADQTDLNLQVFLTGQHMVDGSLALGNLPGTVNVHQGGANLGGKGSSEAASAISKISSAMGQVIDKTLPDCVFVVGDRLDMLPAVVTTVGYNLPIIHLHGGECSEGAIDDRIRNAISKLSHIHCTATKGAATKLNLMGEEAWRIHVTGAPGLDSLLEVPELNVNDLAEELGLNPVQDFILVTVHPETNSTEPFKPLESILTALDICEHSAVITAPNMDPGGSEILSRIRSFVSERPRIIFRDTLGTRLYANAMRFAKTMMGNSSSGIVEAGLFGLPVIDIGSRQQGREHDSNVYHCNADPSSILCLLDKVMSTVDQQPRKTRSSIYGDGLSAPRVAGVISEALKQREQLLVKKFSNENVEFVAPWL